MRNFSKILTFAFLFCVNIDAMYSGYIPHYETEKRIFSVLQCNEYECKRVGTLFDLGAEYPTKIGKKIAEEMHQIKVTNNDIKDNSKIQKNHKINSTNRNKTNTDVMNTKKISTEGIDRATNEVSNHNTTNIICYTLCIFSIFFIIYKFINYSGYQYYYNR